MGSEITVTTLPGLRQRLVHSAIKPPHGRRWPAAVAVGAAGTLLFLTAPAASAHDTSLPDAPYYRSTITAVTPAIPGLQLQITSSGETVTLTNHTGSTVMVLGYEGEDYLRLTSSGVDENTNSLSAFLNGSLVIQGLPQDSEQHSRSDPPAWKHVSDTPTFSWHDHRVHWMAQQRPPVVAADPGSPHHVFDWKMGLTVGAQPVTVKGTLDWTGAPRLSGLSLALLIVAAVATGLCLALLMIRIYLKRRDAVREALPAATALDDDELLPREPARPPLADR